MVTATAADAERLADDLSCFLTPETVGAAEPPAMAAGRRPNDGPAVRGAGRAASGLGDAALRAGEPRGRTMGRRLTVLWQLAR